MGPRQGTHLGFGILRALADALGQVPDQVVKIQRGKGSG